jgi:hypothetical protein
MYIKVKSKLKKMIKQLNSGVVLMGLLTALASVLVLSGCQSSKSKANDNQDSIGQSSDTGFVSIFDGKTLDGWKGKSGYWRVENGAIVGQETQETAPKLKANTFLIWQGGEPSDFVLKAEYKISKNGNSGVQYRSEKVKGVPYGLKGYQFDMDGHNSYTGQNYEERIRDILAWPGQKVVLPKVSGPVSKYAKGNVWTASIVKDTLISKDALHALINEGWNQIKIVAKGNHLQHYINGVLVCDITDNDTANRKSKGLIGFQLHAGLVMKVEFKNIKLKQL